MSLQSDEMRERLIYCDTPRCLHLYTGADGKQRCRVDGGIARFKCHRHTATESASTSTERLPSPPIDWQGRGD